MRELFAAALAALTLSSAAQATIITGAVTANGNYNPAATLSNLSDGITPANGTGYNTPGQTVWWGGSNTFFTIDFGDLVSFDQALLSVDHNDNYLVSYSTDGVSFTDLFSVLRTEGTVNWGIEAFEKSFDAVTARYLRVSASGGDNLFAVGELHVTAAPPVTDVPEPAIVGLLGVGLAGVAALRGRRRG
ncbi:PEP-CTERM sorting domain-containing protein [Pedomonas mirosovicensis]|uniref:PEP-CTERM sorting domain-containing protein n=1 Tax=Pedomonas mirosovicensis TaxID=2908641 RepID=UPI00216A0D9F|nr:PEP-CTERM sorting domain-containing protein [Pedomonas mirosovicensis]MCH8685902.1 PEP-CTERM sorting domain-containing protein [Pedomonas mirosovicensis]